MIYRTKPDVLRFVATLGPVGSLPVAPGTWGSFVAVVAWWFLLKPLPIPLSASILVAVTLLAVWTSTHAEKRFGRDARQIIIDEVVGQWIVLIGLPATIPAMIAGFFVFRLFDVWKPYPIRQSQRIPAGWGVVIDDLLAGFYALVVLRVIIDIISQWKIG